MPGFKVIWVNPTPGARQRGIFEETVHFRLCIRTSQEMEAHDFIVRMWTNLSHKGNNEGEWHIVAMPYLSVAIKSDDKTVDYLYGVDLTLTCEGKYGFNYRAICKRNKKTFKSETSTEMKVVSSVYRPPITEWIQYPMVAQITANIWMGNHAAALEAPGNGYDCLVNAADDAPVFVQQLNRPIILRKFPIAIGANNAISPETIQNAVSWLRESSLRCDKILVFSKYGTARAASLLLAYIYARNPDLTFEEAAAFVDKRCPSYYHHGLKRTLATLYPRG